MKLAFSTVACPNWDFETIVARAKEYGYQGVELRGFLNESVLTQSNPFLTDLGKVREVFSAGGVEIACLSSSAAFTDSKSDIQTAAEVRQFVDTAAGIGCPLVKVFDTQVKPGKARSSAGIALGDWLMPLADYAADRGVSIVVENALSFRDSKELWAIMDRLQHPALGVCWDILNATLIGESPAVSVATLNSRILYVQVKDAKVSPQGVTYCPIGQGDVPLQKLIQRLRGIGYKGYVAVEWEKAWLPSLAEPEEILPQAAKQLGEWIKPPEKAPAKAAPAKKPAAAAAAKA
jgi:sugar phosphate isomerase/epimerase